jgi:hypothetical protein
LFSLLNLSNYPIVHPRTKVQLQHRAESEK